MTDASLLAIPIPMLWKLKVPLKKKIVIGIILSSGVFVIAAAIIRAVLSLDTTPSASNINRWGVRETIIGLITVNVPVLRPLTTGAFWKMGAYNPSAVRHNTSYGTDSRAKTWKGNNTVQSRMDKDDVEMGVTTIKTSPVGSISSNSSQENILHKDSKNDGFVSVQTTYEITSQERGDVASMAGTERGFNGIGVPR